MLDPGVRAPAFHLKDVSGSEVSLADLLATGPVLIAFFKVSCPTCQYTLPFLQRVPDTSALAVVGISQDEREPTLAFCCTYGIRFAILLDRAKERYPASNAYRITTVPSQFLIQPDGLIAQSFRGFSRADLEEIARPSGSPLFLSNERIPEYKPG